MIAVAVTMVMLFAPARDVPAGPEGSDKLVHCLMFAALVFAGAYARIPLRALAPALVAYGGVAELIQGQIGRDADLWDWLSDSAGIALAVAVVLFVRSRHH
ncbi:VanZ family protein [Fodinicola acaciae]|uniref:VanZ family protein n=1 Tax=Fodinicola acaciae TaxID=2681555 RepID=UPI001C9E220A|nr:VanZ family protein [Fodinicola acaciae]